MLVGVVQICKPFFQLPWRIPGWIFFFFFLIRKLPRLHFWNHPTETFSEHCQTSIIQLSKQCIDENTIIRQVVVNCMIENQRAHRLTNEGREIVLIKGSKAKTPNLLFETNPFFYSTGFRMHYEYIWSLLGHYCSCFYSLFLFMVMKVASKIQAYHYFSF